MSVIKNKNENKIIIATLFIWVGFLISISFLESWLKFQAEGVTLKIGVSIGRLVFEMLNKAEIIFSMVLIGGYIFKKLRNEKIGNELKCLYLPVSIVLFQTLYLLPILDSRALMIMKNINPPTSNIHILYVLLLVMR